MEPWSWSCTLTTQNGLLHTQFQWPLFPAAGRTGKVHQSMTGLNVKAHDADRDKCANKWKRKH